MFISKERQTSSDVINTILMIGRHRAVTHQHQGPSKSDLLWARTPNWYLGIDYQLCGGISNVVNAQGGGKFSILEVQSRHPTQVLGEAIIVSVWREVTFEMSLER